MQDLIAINFVKRSSKTLARFKRDDFREWQDHGGILTRFSKIIVCTIGSWKVLY